MRNVFKTLSMVVVVSCMLPALTSSAVAAQDSPDAPNAHEVIAKASAAMAAASSIHFTLDVKGDTYVDTPGTIRLIHAEGDLLRPGKVSVQFKVQILGTATATIKMITIVDKSWTTDLLTGKWGLAPPEFGYDPSILFDTNNGLGPVISKLTDVKITGTEKVDGRDAYKIAGTSSDTFIGPLTADTMAGTSYAVELWVDKENSQLLKITLAEPENNGKPHPATWTMEISNYNADVKIEAPE